MKTNENELLTKIFGTTFARPPRTGYDLRSMIMMLFRIYGVINQRRGKDCVHQNRWRDLVFLTKSHDTKYNIFIKFCKKIITYM